MKKNNFFSGVVILLVAIFVFFAAKMPSEKASLMIADIEALSACEARVNCGNDVWLTCTGMSSCDSGYLSNGSLYVLCDGNHGSQCY